MAIDQTTGAPAEDQSVTIAGTTYTLRAGTLAAYEISAMNLDPSEIFRVSDKERKVTSFAHVLRLFRALIAHNFVARKQPVPSAEEIAMMLEGSDPKLFEEISKKTLEMIFPKLMALTQTVKLQEAAPVSEPLPN